MLDLLQTREYFHILVNVDIDDTHLYAVEVASECRLIYNEKNITRPLEDMNFILSW